MYFLTTLRVLRDGTVDDKRTVAMADDYEMLVDNTLNNTCDICECGYYNFAVITDLDQGFYPSSNEKQWFKMNYDRITEFYGHTTIEKIEEKPFIIKDYNIYIIG